MLLSSDFVLFNASRLFRVQYRPFNPQIWRHALKDFLAVSSIPILRAEAPHITVILRDITPTCCTHNAEVYIHLGLLPSALTSLGYINPEQQFSVFEQCRDLLAQRTTQLYTPNRRLIVPPTVLQEIIVPPITHPKLHGAASLVICLEDDVALIKRACLYSHCVALGLINTSDDTRLEIETTPDIEEILAN